MCNRYFFKETALSVRRRKKEGERPPKPSRIRPSIANDKRSEGQRCFLIASSDRRGGELAFYSQSPGSLCSHIWMQTGFTYVFLRGLIHFGLPIPNRDNTERKALTKQNTPEISLYFYWCHFFIFYLIFFWLPLFWWCFPTDNSFVNKTGQTGTQTWYSNDGDTNDQELPANG